MITNHIRTAIDNVRRSPFQALAAVFVLTLTFFVATNVAVLTYCSQNVLKYFATKPQIIAFLKDEATNTQVADLQNQLLGSNKVKNMRYVSKEEALKIYKEATSDNPLLAELVSPSVFPASLEFSAVDISLAQGLINEVKKEEIVDSVGFTASLGGEKNLPDVVGQIKKITLYIEIGGAVFVGILGFTSYLVLLVIIGMRMALRRSEVEILNLIGAKPAFIRSPIMLEALIYAFSGVFLGFILSFVLWLYAAPTLVTYFGEITILPKETLDFFLVFAKIVGIELISAVLLAIFGSILAVSRARRTQ